MPGPHAIGGVSPHSTHNVDATHARKKPVRANEQTQGGAFVAHLTPTQKSVSIFC